MKTHDATVVTLVNLKGGCGKTTTSINLSYGLAGDGYRTLLIDHDPQKNATVSTGVCIGAKTTLYDAIVNGEPLPHYKVVKNLDIVPSDERLFNLDKDLANIKGRNSRLANLIEPIKKEFDVIVIDCPPNNGIASNGSLIAADHVLIPAEAALFSLQGIKKMELAIEAARHYNSKLQMLGIVITRYRKSKDHEFALAEVRGLYGDKVFGSIIREASCISAAQLARTSVFEYAPRSNGSADYTSLLDEIIVRLDLERYGRE